MNKKFNCHFCKLPIDDGDMEIMPVGQKQHKFHVKNKCYSKHKAKEMRKITKDSPEYAEWCNLHDYVKYTILKYNDKMKLSPGSINHLLNLRNGEMLRKGDKVVDGGYPFEIIRKTFALKRFEIEKALSVKQFKNENMKFAYIMAIVKESINDVYDRYIKVQKQEVITAARPVDISLIPKEDSTYVKKTKETNVSSMLNDLW